MKCVGVSCFTSSANGDKMRDVALLNHHQFVSVVDRLLENYSLSLYDKNLDLTHSNEHGRLLEEEVKTILVNVSSTFLL